MASVPDALPIVEIESLLTCSICLETLNDPRTLPCFHSFCKCCLEKFVKKQREKAVGKEIKDFNCPTCRSVFTLKPKEEVEGMSGSHFIRNMLDVMAIQRRAKVAKCSRCEKSATRHCVTCDIFMCEECFAIHESWPGFKKHNVLTINELTQPENQGMMRGTLHCKEHKDKKLKFFCETCKELICRYCMDFKHVRPDHSCLPIEEVAEKGKELLVSSFGILKGKLMQGNEALQAISNARKALEEDAKKAKDEIKKEKEEIKEAILGELEERARVKVNEVDEAYNEMDEKLVKQETEMKSFVEKMKRSIALSQNLLKRGNNEEILSSQKMIEGSVEKAQKEFPESVEPTAGTTHRCIQYRRLTIDYGDLVEFLNALGVAVCTSLMRGALSDASIILKDKKEYVNQMVEWLEDLKFKWRLCYRASRDGWKAQDFHDHCDNKGPTVTLVKVNDYVFGGFTDQNWEGDGLKRSTSSFLFSLKNKDNLPPFKVLTKNPDKAIFAYVNYGPNFGDQCGCCPDLHISTKKGRSCFGFAYSLPGGYHRSNASYCLLAGTHQFTPTEVEVFY